MSGIIIERWPTDVSNFFEAPSTVDTFTLTYDIQWDSVSVYGRQDAIHSYKATGQTVSFSFPYSPVEKGAKDPETGEILFGTINDITNILSSLTRPVYDANGQYIERSPIVRVTLLKGSSFYLNGPFLMAPTSVTVDYGDRIRNIQSQIYGNNSEYFEEAAATPAKLLISFSGPIIHQNVIYKTMKRSISPTSPDIASEAQISQMYEILQIRR